jgi:hypothetical protein
VRCPQCLETFDHTTRRGWRSKPVIYCSRRCANIVADRARRARAKESRELGLTGPRLRPGQEPCQAEGCTGHTFESKPFCPDHIDRLDSARKVSERAEALGWKDEPGKPLDGVDAEDDEERVAC